MSRLARKTLAALLLRLHMHSPTYCLLYLWKWPAKQLITISFDENPVIITTTVASVSLNNLCGTEGI